MLVNPVAAAHALETLTREDFFREAHALVFEACHTMSERKMGLDVVTLMAYLRSADLVEQAGGLGYVSKLTDGMSRSANITYYCDGLRDLRIKRECLAVADKITVAVQSGDYRGPELVGEAEQWVVGINKTANTTAVLSPQESATRFLAEIERRMQAKGGMIGVPTGYESLDELTCGLQRGNLVLLAARPSVGKSALVSCMALNAARAGHTVLYFTLEMTSEELDMRFASMLSGVTIYKIQHGYLSDLDQQRIGAAMALRAELPIYVDETPGISAPQIRAKARQVQSKHGLGVVIVDYLQLMGGGGWYENRQLEVADISRQLLHTGRTLGVPIIGLSQLSRAGDGRKDPEPKLSDLRESGALEQDAHVVLALHREDYKQYGDTDLLILKNRNGQCGKLKLLFDGTHTQFTQLN